MKKKHPLKSSIVLSSTFLGIAIMLWLSLSVLRTLYNGLKFFFQDRYLIGMSQQEVSREVYGSISDMARQLSLITEGRPFLLAGDDGRLYYFLRYLLYPQRIYWVNNTSLKEERDRPWRFVYYPNGRITKAGHKTIRLRESESGKPLGAVVEL